MAAQRPVLVIAEDHDATRALLQEVLEEEGYVVEAFADGVSALTRLGAHTAAAIILDWQLPDVKGVLVCRAIRSREQGASPHLPIVVLSGHGERGRDEALAAGADAYLPKPFELDDLLTCLRARVG